MICILGGKRKGSGRAGPGLGPLSPLLPQPPVTMS